MVLLAAAQIIREEPRPHSKTLPRDIADALIPVYRHLGDLQLLTRCLSGETQNSESSHSLLWRTCPKERWAGHQTLDTALAISVQRHKRSTALPDVMLELDLTPGRLAEKFEEMEDLERVKSASRMTSNKEKDRRKKIDDICRREREQHRQ